MRNPRESSRKGQSSEAPPGLEAEVVRAALARLLASADFDASERNRRFLDHVVEETLAGRGDRIKAYSIGVAVLDRDADFDPQSDPIVRIEASRLRRSLERYYLLAGRDDPIRIEIPKGGYVPVFRRRRDDEPAPGSKRWPAAAPPEDVGARGEDAAPPAARAASQRALRPLPFSIWSPQPVIAGLLALVFLGLGGFGAWSLGWQPWAGEAEPAASAPVERQPSLMVVPFEDLGREPGDHFAEGVTQEILSSLIRFQEFTVFDARMSLQTPETDPLGQGRRLGADYALTGTVRRDRGRVRVSSQLIKLASGASIWAETYDEELDVERLFEIQNGIAANVAATVAQPYGVVYSDLRNQLRRHQPETLSAYQCLLEAYAYRRHIARELHATVRGCLEEAVVHEPDYADALAMLAVVYVDEFRWDYNPRPDQGDPLDGALEMARRAVETAPDNALARYALFVTHFFRGELDRAFAAGERAVALNPNNPELRAELGMRLMITGEWERGTRLVREALSLNPAPPGWYYMPLSVNALRQGRDAEALRWAEKIDMPNFYWTHVLRAASLGRLSRQDDATRAAARLLELYPDFEERALTEFRRRHFEPALLDRLVDGLRKAGLDVPLPSATGPLG